MTIYAIIHSFNGSPYTYHGFYINESWAWNQCLELRDNTDDHNYTVNEVKVNETTW